LSIPSYGSLYWGEQIITDKNGRKAEGRGIMITGHGDIYEGWFKNEKMHGPGRHISP